jgi:hypothetical protein
MVRGRFCAKRCGPSRHRLRDASAVLENFARHPKKVFQHYRRKADLSFESETRGCRPKRLALCRRCCEALPCERWRDYHAGYSYRASRWPKSFKPPRSLGQRNADRPAKCTRAGALETRRLSISGRCAQDPAFGPPSAPQADRRSD